MIYLTHYIFRGSYVHVCLYVARRSYIITKEFQTDSNKKIWSAKALLKFKWKKSEPPRVCMDLGQGWKTKPNPIIGYRQTNILCLIDFFILSLLRGQGRHIQIAPFSGNAGINEWVGKKLNGTFRKGLFEFGPEVFLFASHLLVI